MAGLGEVVIKIKIKTLSLGTPRQGMRLFIDNGLPVPYARPTNNKKPLQRHPSIATVQTMGVQTLQELSNKNLESPLPEEFLKQVRTVLIQASKTGASEPSDEKYVDYISILDTYQLTHPEPP